MINNSTTHSRKHIANFKCNVLIVIMVILYATPSFSQDWTPGGINVKFYDQYLPIEIHKQSGYVVTNLTCLNNLSQQYGLLQMQRIFGDVAPEIRGWYALVFEDTLTVETIVDNLNTQLEVIVAEPNYLVEDFNPPNDANYGLQWANDLIRSPQTWDNGDGVTGSNQVIVAIIDGGTDWLHNDLAGSYWINVEEDDGDFIFEPDGDDQGEMLGVGDEAPGLYGQDDDGDGQVDILDREVQNADYDQDGEILVGENGVLDSWYNENDELVIDGDDDPEDLVLMVNDDDENGWIDDVIGYDFNNWPFDEDAEHDNNPMDFTGHGTHIAGIIGAITNNGVSYEDERGELGMAGMAGGWTEAGSGVQYMVIKAWGDGQTGGGCAASAKGMRYAAMNGAHFANLSFGGTYSEELYTDALNSATGTDIDEGDTYFNIGAVGPGTGHTLFISAAGNQATQVINYPAGYPTVLSVCATDDEDSPAYFTTYGTWTDISAPGVNIYSTLPRGDFLYRHGGHPKQPLYDYMNGTSMACPYVVGLAALIKSAHQNLTGSQIVQRILGTAVDINSNTDPLSHALRLGSGRIDVFDAVNDDPHPRFVINSVNIDDGDDNILQVGEQVELSINFINVWAAAANTNAVLSTGTENVQVIEANSFLGQYGTAEEGSNVEDPWTIFVEEDFDFESETIAFTVTFTADGGFEDEREFPQYVNPPNVGNFPLDIGSRLQSSPALIDINNDDSKDIIIGSQDGNLHAFDNQGNNLDTYQTNAPISAAPAIADIDNDGDCEIVIGNDGGNIYAFTLDNNIIFGPINLNNSPIFGTLLIDGNNDGDLEIIVATVSPNGEDDIFVLDNAGELLWSTEVLGAVSAGPIGGDIDNNGGREFIVGTRPDGQTDGRIYAFDVMDGEDEIWNVDRDVESLVLGDVDDDGDLELATLEFRNDWTWAALRNTVDGAILNIVGFEDSWEHVLSDVIIAEVISDFSGLEIVYTATANNDVVIFSTNAGNLFPMRFKRFLHNENHEIVSAPLAVDIDGDGESEIIFSSANEIMATDNNLDALPGFPIFKLESTENPEPHPVIDATAGQELHLIAGSDDGEQGLVYNYALGSNANPRTALWPTFQHDNQRTGCYSQPVEGQLPENSLVRWQGRVSINNNLIVPANTTLQIDPGTVVEIDENVDVIVNGTLLALGNHADSVYFICSDSEKYWGKIKLMGQPAQDSRFEFCSFERMSTGIYLDQCTLSDNEEIADCRFRFAASDGIHLFKSNTDVINCAFYKCASGVFVNQDAPNPQVIVSESDFFDCQFGIYAYSADLTITNNTITMVNGPYTQNAGILIMYGNAFNINGNIVSGVQASYQYGIDLYFFGGFGTLISENQINTCEIGIRSYFANPRLTLNDIGFHSENSMKTYNFSQPDMSNGGLNRLNNSNVSEMWIDTQFLPLIDNGHNDIFNFPDLDPNARPFVQCNAPWGAFPPANIIGNYWGSADPANPEFVNIPGNRFLDSEFNNIPVFWNPRDIVPNWIDNFQEDSSAFYLAIDFEEDGDWDAADQIYRRLINESPTNKFGLSSLSRLFFLQEHRTNPRQRSQHYSRFAAYYLDRANAVEDTSFSKLSRDIASYAMVKAGNHEEPIRYYESILRRNPCLRDSIYALIDAGFAYLDAELRYGVDSPQSLSSQNGDKSLNENTLRSRVSTININDIPKQTSSIIDGRSAERGFGEIESLKPESIKEFGDQINSLLALLDSEVLDQEDIDPLLPDDYFLAQSYPNPFNEKAIINFGLPEDGFVKLEVFDIMGRRVSTIIDRFDTAGYHSATWVGKGESSGIYFYRLESGSFQKTQKMMLLR